MKVRVAAFSLIRTFILKTAEQQISKLQVQSALFENNANEGYCSRVPQSSNSDLWGFEQVACETGVCASSKSLEWIGEELRS